MKSPEQANLLGEKADYWMPGAGEERIGESDYLMSTGRSEVFQNQREVEAAQHCECTTCH